MTVNNETQRTHPGPVISVVTCTYNSERFLEKCLRSVENQSYSRIEHIINDSYSTDRTAEIIDDYVCRNQGRYPIRMIETVPRGVADALNRATAAATGEIIHYLHSDDYYLTPQSLERAAAYFTENPGLAWLTGNFLVEIKGKVITIPHSHILKKSPETMITLTNFIHHENTFTRREEVFKYGGFCEDKTMNVEYRLWLRLIQDHKPLVVNNTFTVFTIHKGSTSTGSINQFSKAIFRGFRTLQRERVFPFVGYYERNSLYLRGKKFLTRIP